MLRFTYVTSPVVTSMYMDVYLIRKHMSCVNAGSDRLRRLWPNHRREASDGFYSAPLLPEPAIMSFLPSGNIFRELQVVHDTGYFSSQPSLEDRWQQVWRCFYISLHMPRTYVSFDAFFEFPRQHVHVQRQGPDICQLGLNTQCKCIILCYAVLSLAMAYTIYHYVVFLASLEQCTFTFPVLLLTNWGCDL